jgi:hypothetical protein
MGRFALPASFIFAALLFGFGLHVLVTKLSFDLAVAAFTFRVLMDVGNKFFGYLFGEIVHIGWNSFVVTIFVFSMVGSILWLVPVLVVVMVEVYSYYRGGTQ